MLEIPEALHWDDQPQVLDYFKAWLAICEFPCPRPAILNGVETSPFADCDFEVTSALDLASIRSFAGDLSPREFFDSLMVSWKPPIPAATCLPLLKGLGIWPKAAGWFKYTRQLRAIAAYCRRHAADHIELDVHATWNGEDAYSIAIYLAALGIHNASISGADFLEPNFEMLQWLDLSHAPEEITRKLHDYFAPRAGGIYSLKANKRHLVTLRKANLLAEDWLKTSCDVVVINGVLGQGITCTDDLMKIVRFLHSPSQKRLCLVDNSAFAIAHPEFNRTLDTILIALRNAREIRQASYFDSSRGQYSFFYSLFYWWGGEIHAADSANASCLFQKLKWLRYSEVRSSL